MTDRSAASIEPPGTGRLLVVDLLNVAYFVSHGATFSPEAMTRRVLRVSQRFIDTVGASHLVYTTDLPGDTWREPIRDKTHSITRYARSRRRLQRRGELPAGVVVPEVAEVLARRTGQRVMGRRARASCSASSVYCARSGTRSFASPGTRRTTSSPASSRLPARSSAASPSRRMTATCARSPVTVPQCCSTADAATPRPGGRHGPS
jgi:hypothetical protein